MSRTFNLDTNAFNDDDTAVVEQPAEAVTPISFAELLTDVDLPIRKAIATGVIPFVSYHLVDQSFRHLTDTRAMSTVATKHTDDEDPLAMLLRLAEQNGEHVAVRKTSFEIAQLMAALRMRAIDTVHSAAPGTKVEELFTYAAMVLQNKPTEVDPVKMDTALKAAQFGIPYGEMLADQTKILEDARRLFASMSPRTIAFAKEMCIAQINGDEDEHLTADDAFTELDPIRQINLMATAINGLVRFWNYQYTFALKGGTHEDANAAPIAKHLHARAMLTYKDLLKRHEKAVEEYLGYPKTKLKELQAFAR